MKAELRKKKIDGLVELIPESYEDARGFLTRLYDEDAFRGWNLPATWIETMQHRTQKKHTLRGLHVSLAPFSEAKLIRAIRGEMLWVSVDIRKDSKTFGTWDATVLSENTKNILVTAPGFAHGCLSLTDDVDLVIGSDKHFSAEHSAGIAWNDIDLQIDWHLPHAATPLLSDRDQSHPSFQEFKKKYIDK